MEDRAKYIVHRATRLTANVQVQAVFTGASSSTARLSQVRCGTDSVGQPRVTPISQRYTVAAGSCRKSWTPSPNPGGPSLSGSIMTAKIKLSILACDSV